MSETKKVPRSEWTPDEIEMDRLVDMNGSPRQMDRINARLALSAMEKRLGKAAMDAMWERIK